MPVLAHVLILGTQIMRLTNAISARRRVCCVVQRRVVLLVWMGIWFIIVSVLRGINVRREVTCYLINLNARLHAQFLIMRILSQVNVR